MGVTNYDALPENQLAANLRNATQTARERKARQRIGGSSIRYYRTDNTGTYAWSGQLDTPSAQSPTTIGYAVFVVTLTSTTSPAFLSSISAQVESSTDGVTWTPIPWLAAPFGAPDWTLNEADAIEAEPFKATYRMFHGGALNSYRRFKLQALTTDPVSISLTRVL